jgi:hypothetical protein
MQLSRIIHTLFVTSLLTATVLADITVTNASDSTSTLAPCSDYFADKWQVQLTMDNQSEHGDVLFNIVPAEFNELDGLSFNDGLLTTTTTGNFPLFRILTPETRGQIVDRDTTRYGGVAPIDPAVYNLLVMRMYSSKKGEAYIRWDKAADQGYGFTTPFDVRAGWHVYHINLATVQAGGNTTAGYTSGSNHGLGIGPALNAPGTQIQVDWVQLTSSSCDNAAVTFDTASGVPYTLFVDNNKDLSDGFVYQSPPAVGNGSKGALTLAGSYLFPGQYWGHAISATDWATLYRNPWDFESIGDLDTDASHQPRMSHFTATNTSGSLCGTVTADDPSFHLSHVPTHTLDADTFSKLSFSYKGSEGVIQVLFFDSSGANIGALHKNVAASQSYQNYTLDLGNPPGTAGNFGTWTGTIADIRFDPEVGTNGTFCFDWISIGSDYVAVEPTSPTSAVSSTPLTVPERPIMQFVQPDRRGGVDYFVSVRGNPANMDAATDIDKTFNLSEASIHPGEQYVDSGSRIYTGDFFKGANAQTGTLIDGDPSVNVVFRDFERPINPDYFKVACLTMDIPEESIFDYHSVLRLGWELDLFGDGSLKGYTADDVVLRSVGEAEYCFELENMPIEESDGVTINGNFWHKGVGQGIYTFRVDPHELEHKAPFTINELRIAAHHEAHTQYAIVVKGATTHQIAVYKTTTNTNTGGTLIGALSPNRTSNVLLWDTSAEAHGTKYYLYAVAGSHAAMAPAPVVINHTSYADTTAPTLLLDTPSSDNAGRYSKLLVIGDVVDNIRVATVEVLLDGVLVDSFLPDSFDYARRNLHPNVPDASRSHFSRTIATSTGPHSVTVKAYDTAGNVASVTREFAKASDNLSIPYTPITPSEGALQYDLADPPSVGQDIALSVTTNGSNLMYQVSGLTNEGDVNNCERVRLKITDTEERLSTGPFTTVFETTSTADISDGTVAYQTINAPQMVAANPPSKQQLKKVKKRLRTCKQRASSITNSKKRRKKNKRCYATYNKKREALFTTPSAFAYLQADCGDGTKGSSVATIDVTTSGTSDIPVLTVSEWIDRVRASGTMQ